MIVKSKYIIESLNEMVPNPRCELNYSKDYELLIAIVLSAQTTDKGVNNVTKILFNKYNLKSLSEASIEEIENIIKPIGTYHNKSKYIINIAKRLINDYNGIVPNNREYLESLPGVGHKTCNVFLSNIYNIPCIAVDTHVKRVSFRLGLTEYEDHVNKVEEKLMEFFPKKEWSKLHHQLVLFGRYICKANNPQCNVCKFNKLCQKNNRN